MHVNMNEEYWLLASLAGWRWVCIVMRCVASFLPYFVRSLLFGQFLLGLEELLEHVGFLLLLLLLLLALLFCGDLELLDLLLRVFIGRVEVLHDFVHCEGFLGDCLLADIVSPACDLCEVLDDFL